MEIQKIFSDMYDEERIYSVLMSEDELALFSEMQEQLDEEAEKAAKKEKRKKAAVKAAKIAGATALAAGTIYGANKGGQYLSKHGHETAGKVLTAPVRGAKAAGSKSWEYMKKGGEKVADKFKRTKAPKA